MGMESIDDVRNGILTFQPVENAFDSLQLCIMQDESGGPFRVYALDPALLSVRLADAARNTKVL